MKKIAAKNESSLKSVLLLCALMNSAAVKALDYSWSGFGTLGAVYDSDKNVHPQRDFGQPDTFDEHVSWRMDSLAGLQLNLNWSPSLTAVIQAVAKERTDPRWQDSLEWAFISWEATPKLRLRAGRIGVDYYLLADYRHVGFAYLWQRPPLEFYTPLMPYHVDGLDLAYQFNAHVTAKIFGGYTPASTFQVGGAGNVARIRFQPHYGASLIYERAPWYWKVGYGHVEFADEIQPLKDNGILSGLESAVSVWPEALTYADELSGKHKQFNFYSLGMHYRQHPWQISAEAGVLRSQWKVFHEVASAYLGAGYHMGRYTPFVLLSGIEQLEAQAPVAQPQTSGLEALYATTRFLYETLEVGQQTFSIGMRSDLSSRLALKTQLDHSWIGAGNSGLWWVSRNKTELTARQVSLFSISLNWVF